MILDDVELKKNHSVFCAYYGPGKVLNIQGNRAVVYFDSGLKQIYDEEGIGIGGRNRSLYFYEPLIFALDRNNRAHADVVRMIDIIYEKYLSIFGN